MKAKQPIITYFLSYVKHYFLFLLFLPCVALGQTVPFKLYTPHDGLPQSQIQCMFQDSRGLIWIGTFNGLSYFDGVKFHNLGVREGLPAQQVRRIMEDEKGNILFTAGRYFCKYDGNKISADTAKVIPNDIDFTRDNNNTYWAINKGDSFLYSSKDFKNWDCVSCEDEKLKKTHFNKVWYDAKEDRLILNILGGDVVSIKNNQISILGSAAHLLIASHSFEKRAILTRKDTIFRLEGNHLTTQIIGNNKKWAIQDAIESQADGNWYFIQRFGSGNNLYFYDKSNNNRLDSISINVSATNFLFEDRANDLWVGTEEGLVRVFLKGFKNYPKDKMRAIWAMAEDAKGKMWFGSYYFPDVIYTQNDENDIIKKSINYNLLAHSNDPNERKNFKGFGNFYFGGIKDDQGNTYFPMNYGIMKYDGRRFVRLDKVKNITVQDVRLSMYATLDKKRNLIVSCTQQGLNLIDASSGEHRYVDKRQGLFCPNFALGASVAKDGKYWIAAGRGINCYDIEQDKVIKRYSEKDKNFHYLGVMCIFSDSKGGIWAGCQNGLLHLDEKKDSFVLVAPEVIRSPVSSLEAYKDKYIVLGATDGVYFVDIEKFYQNPNEPIIHYYNQYNGYTGIEPNQNCIYKDSKDNIWIAASDIVTKIVPSELNFGGALPKPYIVAINNQRIRYQDYNSTIDVPKGINHVKIEYMSVGFNRPFHTEYSYRIDGIQESWTKWSTDDFAVLEYLGSGAYTFQLRTRPTGSVADENSEMTQIHFAIDLPFYKEPYFGYWALGLLGLALTGGVALEYKNRIDQQKAKQKELALIQQNELKELETQKKDKELKYLQSQMLLTQLNPHFIFNVLATAQTKIEKDDRKTASSLVVQLANLIRRFLESSYNSNMNKLAIADITLEEEIELIRSYIKFEQMQYGNSFDYEIQIDKNVEASNIPIMPMLIQPFVENAIKHGILSEKIRRCKLEIRFSQPDEDKLVCFIIDNGVGREKARAIQSQRLQMYKSRGTEIIKERILLLKELGHQIDVDILDNPIGGTIVRLEIEL